MGSRRILEMVWALFFFMTGAGAQSNCTNVIAILSPCLDYITGNSSSSSSPSSECCNQLSNVVKENGECLCEVINGTLPLIGVSINQTRALELPGSCNLMTPSINQCNVTANAPPGTTNGSPGTPGTPSGGGEPSDGYKIKMPFVDDQLFLILLIMATLASIFTAIV